MTKKFYFFRLLNPILVMLLLACAILLEKKGFTLEARQPLLPILDKEKIESAVYQEPAVLVIVNRERTDEVPFTITLTDTLNEMKIAFHTTDLSQEELPDLSQFSTILFCSQSMLPLEHDIMKISNWINDGGHFGLMMSQQSDEVFRIFYRKLGIIEYGLEFYNFKSIEYVTNLLPLFFNTKYDEDGLLTDYAMPVQLEKDCIVHITTAEEPKLPLLWEHPCGKGRTVVFNTSLMNNKAGRGFVLSILFALEDTIVYPIINAGMVYIDDFPAPQPEGKNKALLDAFGYDIQGFYRNHWWPDMKQLTWKYGLRYTGVLIETYNDNVEGPFNDKGVDNVLLKFYTSELLHSGGELGLHGYNHMPLCPDGFPYQGENYKTWPSTEKMSEGLQELVRYGDTLLLEPRFSTYVPPSNYLSDQGRQTIRETIPQIKVISGLYLREEGVNALVQEFREEPDGLISVPRVTSGFVPTDFSRFTMAQELLLHGVFSHFIHPDDLLDELRGASLGWDKMHEVFLDFIKEVINTYPVLRFSTSTEGAAAVQRYDRLTIHRKETEDALDLSLSPFYDEAWMALRTRNPLISIEGGEIHEITSGFYWIKANSPEVHIEWKAKQ